MTLIELITHEITTDDSGGSGDSDRIVERYEAANRETKEAIDDIFISMCGWSLKTLIGKADPEVDDEEDE